jgi:GntR family transcriptional regulator/MocR family aminotransferase
MPKLGGQGALLPFVDLDPGDRVPLHQQLTQQLRVAILTGQLHAGQRLPASRTLAAQLQVSRSTVVAAFEQLVDEGYLESDVGSGTFVSSWPHSSRSPAAP